jgi:hypothetical protein
VKQANAKPDEVAAFEYQPTQETGQTTPGAGVLIAATEAAVAAGKVRPSLVAKLDLLEEKGVFMPKVRAIESELLTGIRAYQEGVAARVEAAIKG